MIRGRLAGAVDREQFRELPGEQLAVEPRVIAGDAALEERAFRTRIDDRRTQFRQVRDRAIDDRDGFRVGGREQRRIHVLADDADADTVETRLVGEARVGAIGRTADLKRGELVLGVVAGDDVEDAGRVFDGPANRSDPGVDALLNHAVTADQFLSGSDPDGAVGTGRSPHR